jgi:hypothetical protein
VQTAETPGTDADLCREPQAFIKYEPWDRQTCSRNPYDTESTAVGAAVLVRIRKTVNFYLQTKLVLKREPDSVSRQITIGSFSLR